MNEEQRRRREERRRWEERRARRKRRRRLQIILRLMFCVLILVLAAAFAVLIRHITKTEETAAEEENVIERETRVVKYVAEAPDFSVELLEVNEYSRPGDPIDTVNGIVVHYTANPGTTAEQNRSYFQNLAETGETYASSHFIIGIEGEIIQCIPCSEKSYASNERNSDTISIECCIPDETGKFSDATYDSLVKLATWLMGRYELTTDEVIRHYDITGKNCPKYYVEHEDAWEQFKTDLTAYIDTYGIEKTVEIN